MYHDYFGFRSNPFSIAPDPKFVFLSDRHREALAHLIYGAREGGGFVLLTGEVGTGKTTLCRCLLEQIPENTDVAFIVNPRQNSLEILQSVCDELGVSYYQPQVVTLKYLVDRLNAHLLDTHRQGRNTILIIDEAQNLSVDVLEQLRLLTNLETSETKLLRLILLGQPELRDLLSRSELRQLSQRITARYHLTPLNKTEVGAYLQHRLHVAGFRGDLFTPAAVRRVYAISGGIPRIINILCDRALLGVYASQGNRVDAGVINRAAVELQQSLPLKNPPSPHRWLSAFIIVLVLLSAAACWWFWPEVSPWFIKLQQFLEPLLPSARLSNPAGAVLLAPASLLTAVEDRGTDVIHS